MCLPPTDVNMSSKKKVTEQISVFDEQIKNIIWIN